MGVALPGGAPTAAQVKAALVGQDVSANSYTATTTAGPALSAPNLFAGNIIIQLMPGQRIDFGVGASQFFGDGSGNPTFSAGAGPIQFASFTDGSGTTGNQTMNVTRGIAAFAAASSSIVITNNKVTSQSTVLCVLQTNDSTAILKNVVPAAGSFTINLNAAATGTTKVSFLLFGS